MGNDGGSIPQRCDTVRERTKEIKKDYFTMNKNRSKYCAISNDILAKPVVGCKMGYLYNKEVLYKSLVDKTIPKAFRHIKRAKHLRDISTLDNPDPVSEYPFVCPLSKIEFNGLTKFVFLWSCGCMMSYKLLEIYSLGQKNNCPSCGKSFDRDDIVSLTYSPEELEKKKLIMFKVPEVTSSANKSDEPTKKLKTEGDVSNEAENGDQLPSEEVMDKTMTKGSNMGIYKGLFHNKHEVENANDLCFRNVRFGIR